MVENAPIHIELRNIFADRNASDPQSWNIYAYTRNNPLRYVDRNGEVLETWWDAINVGVGIASFIGNVRQGNAGAAAVDAVGVVADSIATAVPFVPGGAGTIIRSARAVDKAADLVEAAAGARTLENVADGAGAARGVFGRSIWGRADTLKDHFLRHGGDFGAKNPDEYAQISSDFFRRSQASRLPTKVDDGVIRVYDPKTNTFGSFNPDGTTRTFFKPKDGSDYWDEQPGITPMEIRP